MNRVTLILTSLLSTSALFASGGCKENEAASKACKGESASSDDCADCCQKNGASGHKYINGACSCLGG